MSKYQLKGHRVYGAAGTVSFSETRGVLRDFNLEAKWNSKADGYVGTMQLRDIADGGDHYLLATRYKVPGGFVIIAKVDADSFMVSQGIAKDWDGRYAIKVTQQELKALFK